MSDVARALKRLSPTVRDMLEMACGGEWDRVTVDSFGQFTVHNKAPSSRPVRAHLALAWQSPGAEPEVAVAAPVVVCGRCDTPGHSVLDCEQPLRRKAAVASPKRKLRTVPLEELASALGVSKDTTSTTTIVSAPARPREEVAIWVEPDANAPKFDWAAVDLKQTAYRFCTQYRDGLPAGIGFAYLPDVLALYGVDTDLTEDTLRAPERVEVRPESFSKQKGYPVLGFYRGDVQVILGLKEPVRPCVIAVYVGSRLENDTHRVENHGGGAGGKAETGLPKTPGQLQARLRSMGCDLTVDLDHKTAEVVYKGHSLGKVRVDRALARRDVENEWQRTQRRIAGVNRAS